MNKTERMAQVLKVIVGAMWSLDYCREVAHRMYFEPDPTVKPRCGHVITTFAGGSEYDETICGNALPCKRHP